jgi:hypothetical protein
MLEIGGELDTSHPPSTIGVPVFESFRGCVFGPKAARRRTSPTWSLTLRSSPVTLYISFSHVILILPLAVPAIPDAHAPPAVSRILVAALPDDQADILPKFEFRQIHNARLLLVTQATPFLQQWPPNSSVTRAFLWLSSSSAQLFCSIVVGSQ